MPIVPLANVNRENLFSISFSLTFVKKMAQTLCWQELQNVKKYVGNDKPVLRGISKLRAASKFGIRIALHSNFKTARAADRVAGVKDIF